MKKGLWKLWLSISALLLTVSPAFGEIPNDFDGDGVSDIVFTNIGSNGNLIWKAVLSSSGVETTISSGFGVSGNSTVTGYWRYTASPPDIALLRYDPVEHILEWKMQLPNSPVIINKEFGKGSIFAAAGADFDGDGIGDAAVVRQKGKSWRWTIRTKPFADSGSTTRKVTFGKIKDRVFYMNPGGPVDHIATFGTCSRKYACVRMAAFPGWKKISTGRFPRSLATRHGRPRPVPIMQADGVDALAFITEGQGERRIRVFRKTGSRIADVSIAQLGGYAVGDYLPAEAGEEIAVQYGSSILFFNPFTGTPTPGTGTPTPITATPTPTIGVDGTLVDGILTEVLIPATPTASPVPTPTAISTGETGSTLN